MNIVITLILALFIIGLLFFLLSRIKTPYYRVDRERMTHVLEMVLTGNATETDWNITFGMTLRHSPALEALRLVCVDIEEGCYIGEQRPPYLFSAEGLDKLQQVLETVRAMPD
jgi:hypothetical protein